MLDKYLPPTDNLYKFMAISGLMFLALAIVPFLLNFKLSEMRIQRDAEFDLANIEKENTLRKDKIELDYKKFILSQAFNPNLTPNEEEKIYDEYLEGQFSNLSLEMKKMQVVKKVINESKDLSEKIKEIDTELADRVSGNELIRYYDDQIYNLTTITIATTLFGLILAIFGFYLWYVKFQKPNDFVLKNQAEAV